MTHVDRIALLLATCAGVALLGMFLAALAGAGA